MLNLLQGKLKQFRRKIYSLLCRRQDAIFNLLDALTCHGHRVSSVVQLSESDKFERKYSSITDAISDGLPHAKWDKITDTLYHSANEDNSSRRQVFVVDCTSNQRPFAKRMPDRSINHYPNPAPGNKPICVGHQYSVMAMLPRGEAKAKKWIIPISTIRVKSDEKGNEVGIEQILSMVRKSEGNNKLSIGVGDSLYGTNKCRMLASQEPNLVHIFRLNSRRNVYLPVADGQKKFHQKGRKQEYGDKLSLAALSEMPCSEKSSIKRKTAKGKEYTLNLKFWRCLLLRGNRGFRSSQHPINVMQVTSVDKNGHEMFNRPLWIAVSGKRREEVSAADCLEIYQRRYDIEQFFRFSKQKLLLDSYQTPDLEHEELWWAFSMIAYHQLYLAKELSPIQPKPWERYLAESKNIDEKVKIASPSQAQRGFANVIDDIGSPAKKCVQRGNPLGRSEGEKQSKRPKHPIIFKHSRAKKHATQSNVCGSEKHGDKSHRQTIDDLINFVHSSLIELDLSVEKFAEIMTT